MFSTDKYDFEEAFEKRKVILDSLSRILDLNMPEDPPQADYNGIFTGNLYREEENQNEYPYIGEEEYEGDEGLAPAPSNLCQIQSIRTMGDDY